MNDLLEQASFQNMNSTWITSIYNATLWNLILKRNNSSFTLKLNDRVYDLPTFFKVMIIGCYVITFFVSLTGNITLCYIINSIPKRYNKCFNYLFVSSSINDIVMSIVCIPSTVVSSVIFYWWPFGTSVCPLLQYIHVLLVLQKSFSMVTIVYNQHNSVSKPMNKRLSRRKMLVILTASWVIPIVVAIPTAIYSTVMFLPTTPGSKGLCLTVWPSDYLQSIYVYAIMAGQFFVPFIIIAYLHLRIGCVIWKNQIPGEADIMRDSRIARSKRKSIKMLVAMVITFFFTWLPLHVLTLIGDYNPSIYSNANVHILLISFHWLGLSNSGTNCIFYYLKSSTFRVELRKMISRLSCNTLYKDNEKQIAYYRRARLVSDARADSKRLLSITLEESPYTMNQDMYDLKTAEET